MNNYVIVKWGTLKGYNFSDKFTEKNKEVVEEFKNVWEEIYKNSCSAFGGSKETQKNKDLKLKIVNVLEKIYNLGVPIENGWDDTYYNSFEELKKYILDYEV